MLRMLCMVIISLEYRSSNKKENMNAGAISKARFHHQYMSIKLIRANISIHRIHNEQRDETSPIESEANFRDIDKSTLCTKLISALYGTEKPFFSTTYIKEIKHVYIKSNTLKVSRHLCFHSLSLDYGKCKSVAEVIISAQIDNRVNAFQIAPIKSVCVCVLTK